MVGTRPAAVAGLFYPADAEQLAQDVDRMLDDARRHLDPRLLAGPLPKALILPHAGYVYSGTTAARGYALLAAGRGTVERVVLLGPTHRVAVNGVAGPAADLLATPLGPVRVPEVGIDVRAGLPQLGESAAVHAEEHSLEVHLPFLQRVLGDVEVLPLAVGRASPEATAEVIDAFWGGSETVVVVSSDLSHYLPYDEAAAVDAATVDRMLALDGPLTHEQACGATPANGLLLTARRRGLTATLLGLCNSGDTAGSRRRVVGYAAVALHEPAR